MELVPVQKKMKWMDSIMVMIFYSIKKTRKKIFSRVTDLRIPLCLTVHNNMNKVPFRRYCVNNAYSCTPIDKNEKWSSTKFEEIVFNGAEVTSI